MYTFSSVFISLLIFSNKCDLFHIFIVQWTNIFEVYFIRHFVSLMSNSLFRYLANKLIKILSERLCPCELLNEPPFWVLAQLHEMYECMFHAASTAVNPVEGGGYHLCACASVWKGCACEGARVYMYNKIQSFQKLQNKFWPILFLKMNIWFWVLTH